MFQPLATIIENVARPGTEPFYYLICAGAYATIAFALLALATIARRYLKVVGVDRPGRTQPGWRIRRNRLRRGRLVYMLDGRQARVLAAGSWYGKPYVLVGSELADVPEWLLAVVPPAQLTPVTWRTRRAAALAAAAREAIPADSDVRP